MQKMENISQRKAVLLGQGDIHAVVRGSSLQLKVERDAEALAQGESPGFVDARTKRRMDNQLHAAAFVKKALGDNGIGGGDSAQHCSSGHNVFNGLLRA